MKKRTRLHKRMYIMMGIALVLFGVGIAGTFFAPSIAEAASRIWNSCPRGETNCEYPGKCRSYIDTNNDSICDRSQPAPVQEPAGETQSGAAAESEMPASPSPLVSEVIPECSEDPVTPDTEKGSGAALQPSDNVSTGDTTGTIGTAAGYTPAAGLNGSYYFVPVFLALAILYALTWILSFKAKITRVLHRRIWNLVLLFSTLISALLGLFLILRIDFDINVDLPFDMLFWHVEAGIAMALIAVFHILWHWRYFAKMLQAGNTVEKPVRVKAPSLAEVNPRLKAGETGK
ncbi:MAG: hypothetical protein JXA46_00900 [Dehalococcoidales bacterium]|nr:hypothetical protein [Dehalococcoidales bacterium]